VDEAAAAPCPRGAERYSDDKQEVPFVVVRLDARQSDALHQAASAAPASML